MVECDPMNPVGSLDLSRVWSIFRAMGDYSERTGAGAVATELVNGFFGALQVYDYCLFESIRFDQPLSDKAPALLDDTVAAMDR